MRVHDGAAARSAAFSSLADQTLSTTVEQALARSRAALAESEAALAASRDAERKASQLAMHDQKNGLPNRTLFDDRLAQAIAGAERLMRHARDEDTVCRNGGDEFLYLLINPSGRDTVARIAGVVRESIEAPIGLGALQYAITPSIGIALYPEHGMNGQTLIAHADAAMYRAKQLHSPCEFFEPSMASSVASKRPSD